MRIIAVLTKWDFAQEEIAELVDTITLGEFDGIDDIAHRLRHFFAAAEQEAVHDDALGQGRARRHQKGRPKDCVEAGNVLADHMGVGGPEMDALALPRQKARRGYVIR